MRGGLIDDLRFVIKEASRDESEYKGETVTYIGCDLNMCW